MEEKEKKREFEMEVVQKEMEEMKVQLRHSKNLTTTLTERGEELLKRPLIFTDCVSLCEGQPDETNFKTEFEIDTKSESSMSKEDNSVNFPMYHVLQKLVPPPFRSCFTALSSPLQHNCHEHHVDNVVYDGKIVAWSTVIMFFEGKCKLTDNDLKLAVGQCSQRVSAFMEETKHDHLLSIKPRNIVWACYYNRSYIGFVCRRRDTNTNFPFNLPSGYDNDQLEVVFSKVPFQDEGALQEGGKILWRLLRSKDVLGYFNREESQPSLCLNKPFRPLLVQPRNRHKATDINATDITTIIVAVDRSNNSPAHNSVSAATYAVKFFSTENEYRHELSVYEKIKDIKDIDNTAILHDKDVTCIYNDRTYFGFVISPYGSVLAKTNHKMTIQLANEIGSALQKLHQKNIIHRDITPNNIIFFQDNFFLIDFDVTHVRHGRNYVPNHAFIGTRRWASKRRQKRNKAGNYPDPSPLDDWESLFLTLYDLSCGYDQKKWTSFQDFAEGMHLTISNEFDFLKRWYEVLVQWQKKANAVQADTLPPLLLSVA